MSDTAVVTIVTRNYFHQARTMAISLRESDPEIPVFCCLVDGPEPLIDRDAEPFELFFGSDLALPAWKRFAFQYTGLELSCALKPHAIQHLKGLGFDKVFYCDADLFFYRSLTEASRLLDDCSVLLTPHLTAPLPDDGHTPDESAFLRSGVYNGGFVGVGRHRHSDGFLDWWISKHERDCIQEPSMGLEADQRWLDLVPGMFDGVRILRDPAFNTAYWNLPRRVLSRDGDGEIQVEGKPLLFFHFSGIVADNPGTISVHHDRIGSQNSPLVRDLVIAYVERLETNGLREFQALGYRFSKMTDGTPIQAAWREAIRVGHPLVADLEDPFGSTGEPFRRLKKAARAVAFKRAGVRADHLSRHPIFKYPWSFWQSLLARPR